MTSQDKLGSNLPGLDQLQSSSSCSSNDKEMADHSAELLQATRRLDPEVRRKISWKKRARAAHNHVFPQDVNVAMPRAQTLSVQATDPESAKKINTLPCAIANIKSAESCGSGTCDHGGNTHSDHEAERPYKMAKHHDKFAHMSLDHLLRLMRLMPRVRTSGGILNGRIIEGVLVMFEEATNVVIVCLCHGHFLSPEEFVHHAGGLDLSNCLKLIIVEP